MDELLNMIEPYIFWNLDNCKNYLFENLILGQNKKKTNIVARQSTSMIFFYQNKKKSSLMYKQLYFTLGKFIWKILFN